tara:strand:- start:6 stop:416 length:411 start_codon:yes stop_codon:yes gene_type:complete
MPDSDSDKTAPWWVPLIKSLGVPTCFLIALLYMIWTAAIWAGDTVVVPLFTKQMSFIDEASKMTAEINNSTQLINKTLEAHGQHAIESLKTCQEIKNISTENGNRIDTVRENNDKILDVLKNIEENTEPLKEHPIQ